MKASTWIILKEFGENTNIAGINNAARAKSLPRALLWISLFLAGTVFTIWGIVNTITDFYSYPYLTKTDVEFQTSVTFPAVTVCNLNRMHCGLLVKEKLAMEKQKLDGKNLSELEEKLDDLEDSEAKMQLTFGGQLKALNYLFQDTGCKDQVCIQLDNVLPFNRTRDVQKRNEDLFQAALVECTTAKQMFQKVCYHLLWIIEENVNFEDVQGAKRLWSQKNCTHDLACSLSTKKNDVIVFPNACNGSALNEDASVSSENEDHSKVYSGIDPLLTNHYENDALFVKSYMYLTRKRRARVGHPLIMNVTLNSGGIKGFLHSCTFRGRNCSKESLWMLSQSPNLGNCYTFNSAFNKNDPLAPRRVSLTGANNALTLELFLDQSNYMLNSLSPMAGARMVFHDPWVPAFPDEFGINLRPNVAMTIPLQKNSIIRLKQPFIANCTRFWNETGYGIESNISYTMTGCQKLCQQRAILQTCGCAHPGLFATNLAEGPEHIRICFIVPSEQNSDYVCFQNVLDKFNDQELTCSCNPACNETFFSFHATSSTWPSEQYWPILAYGRGFTEHDIQFDGYRSLQIQQFIQKDFTRADIYFQSLNVQSLVQTAKYTDFGFFSNIGGALSLYVGIATIMVFELMELAFDLMMNMKNSREKKKHDSVSVKPAKY